ncbi:DUF4886 domain-containing protein [Olivibacter sp. LS-1]|uniref:DUF4886 domain-containing protein n=1 Tax=unclassified Olivibacter TaxID=2632301 RepID=UPI0011EB3032|nr:MULTISPECIES: DUF4886 domain-containing protein [unclassified Olivibacter]MDM8177232.1 DUF4886 domain-containing protein [Olivibacter sp. 47]QEL00386.1 DUF4886 domain-containing protein [Olivibacter sp. LS-1]
MYKIKYLLTILFIGLTSLSVVYGQSVSNDTLRVLAIGNSFSEDAVEQYLYELADAAGKKIVIGNLYIGGAPLSLHWENIQGNKEAYRYRKITADGLKSTHEQVSILTALQSEPWDYVSLQQASPLSGKFDTYVEPLTGIKHFLDSVEGANVKYIWHQTWAYAPHSTHAGFANYGKNQEVMYRAIMKASAEAKKKFGFDLLVPSGTAIQNARTTFLGDNLTRDGYHLNLHIGRFIAACTWFESLFGEEAPTDRYRPEGVTPEEAEVAKQAAHAAVKRPFKVTKLKVKALEQEIAK